MIDRRGGPTAVSTAMIVTTQYASASDRSTSPQRNSHVPAEQDHHRALIGVAPRPDRIALHMLDHTGLLIHHEHHRSFERDHRQRLIPSIQNQSTHLRHPLDPTGMAPRLSRPTCCRASSNGRRDEKALSQRERVRIPAKPSRPCGRYRGIRCLSTSMVRMPGTCFIGFSRPYDNGYRLTDRSERDRTATPAPKIALVDGRQPAFARNQPTGSSSEPFMWTSKCRWAPKERPVLPTLPMNCPGCTT